MVAFFDYGLRITLGRSANRNLLRDAAFFERLPVSLASSDQSYRPSFSLLFTFFCRRGILPTYARAPTSRQTHLPTPPLPSCLILSYLTLLSFFLFLPLFLYFCTRVFPCPCTAVTAYLCSAPYRHYSIEPTTVSPLPIEPLQCKSCFGVEKRRLAKGKFADLVRFGGTVVKNDSPL